MNGRFVFVLALSFASTIAACGGDDAEQPQEPKVALSGVYRPVDQGPIGSITFSGSQDYLLMPSGCSGSSCAVIGTYRLDSANRVLVLENGVTHQTRSIAMEIVKTTPASASLVQGLTPRDLIDPGQQLNRPGGQQLNNGSGNQLNNGSGNQLNNGSDNQLSETIQQLLQIVQQFIANAQQMKRDEDKKEDEKKKDDKKEDPKPNPLDCKQGVPTANTPPAEALAYFARCPSGP